jgi:hypothetical protein
MEFGSQKSDAEERRRLGIPWGDVSPDFIRRFWDE